MEKWGDVLYIFSNSFSFLPQKNTEMLNEELQARVNALTVSLQNTQNENAERIQKVEQNLQQNFAMQVIICKL